MLSFLPLHKLLKESRLGKPQSLKLKRLQTGWFPYTLLGNHVMHSIVVPGVRWVPAVVAKVFGSCSVSVRVFP